ncbi:MAG: FAS1-like dehydratase domain-containing protein [Candidatus Dormibacteraceae bacterium]
MPEIAGRAYPPKTTPIEAPRVEAFARALGVDPADGVPPTYAAVYALAATAPQLFGDPEAAIDFSHLLHVEQEFRWTRQPRVGETVTARARVTADMTRRGVRLVTLETACTVGDEPLCVARARFAISSGPGQGGGAR